MPEKDWNCETSEEARQEEELKRITKHIEAQCYTDEEFEQQKAQRLKPTKTEIQEINRGSPSFRLNSIEFEIEIIIRKMVRSTPMKKQDIQNKLSQKYNQSDIAHVIKHSKGIYCDINDIVHYREWVYADVEMVTGV